MSREKKLERTTDADKVKYNVDELIQEHDAARSTPHLKECPFCGGYGRMKIQPDLYSRNYNNAGSVTCETCGATVYANAKEIYNVIAEYLAAKWNRRYTPTQQD